MAMVGKVSIEKKRKHLSEHDRSMIIGMHLVETKVPLIHQLTGVPKASINTLIKRFEETGTTDRREGS